MGSAVLNILIGLTTKSLKYMTLSSYFTMAVSVYAMAGWTIYGYTLSGSAENDCALQIESQGWNTAMIVCMVLGSFTVCYAGCLVCLLPAMIKATDMLS